MNMPTNPAVLANRMETPRPRTPNQNTTRAMFDWTSASFIPVPERIPPWVRITIHIVAILTLLGLPLFLVLFILRNTSKWYPIIADAPPEHANFPMEVVRWCILIASAYVTYGMTLLAINITMYVLNRASQKVVDRDEPPEKIGQVITGVMGLRTYLGMVASTAVLSGMSLILFPLPKEKASTTALAPLTTYVPVLEQSAQFLVTRACISLLVVACILLVEKIIVQRIASMFHYHSAAGRITENNFQLKMTRKLKRALIDSRRLSLSTIQDAPDAGAVGALIFDALKPTGAETITTDAIRGYLSADDVDRFWSMLDPESHGDLRRHEFALAVQSFFDEREDLSRTVTDQTRIIRKLDRLLMVLFSYVAITACMVVFNVSAPTAFAAIGGAGVAFAFVFSSAAKTAFESIVFVIFTHPFDVGDRIILQGDQYIVKELGLWSSTFYGPNRRITYITNSTLKQQMIVNVRRSPLQNEVITVKLPPSTPSERLTALEAKLNEFLTLNQRDYVPPMMLKGYKFADKDHMIVEMVLCHRANFQNSDLKDARTKNFMLFLKDAMEECGIEISPSY